MEPTKKLPARFYRTTQGNEPVREWLKGLTSAERQVIGKDMQKVEFGWPLGLPVCRPLGDSLWEVRSDLPSRRTARVIFCIVAGQMILLHGFMKTRRQARSGPRPRAQSGDGNNGGDAAMSTQPNPHIGSSFDAFLAEEGILEACEEQAIKELVAEQIARAMQEQGLTRTAMAARMRTSRAALNRLLDPTNPSVTLQTLQKAAQVIGKRLRLALVDAAE